MRWPSSLALVLVCASCTVERYTKITLDREEILVATQRLFGGRFPDMQMSCPDEVRLKPDQPLRIECTGSVDDHRFPVVLTRSDNPALPLDLTVKEGIIALPEAAARIQAHLKMESVSCGETAFPSARGRSFRCSAVVGHKPAEVVVTVVDGTGRARVVVTPPVEGQPGSIELALGPE